MTGDTRMREKGITYSLRSAEVRHEYYDVIENKGVPVDEVADSLTSLLPDDEENHKIFTESHVSDLFKADNVVEQFGTMNFHWNYLDPSLLDYLVRDFNLEEVKGETNTLTFTSLILRMTLGI